jgi:cyclopropane fatty-acyl-phospholipid synthase-like methyltransferase
MKDYFSGHSKLYATFRPTYPDTLYDFILNGLAGKDRAWDCGTGNGQVAQVLARHFKHVDATDISAQQLEQAPIADNIRYTLSPAEKTPFENSAFDLITVGQALHWFNRDAFFSEVNRVGKPGATVAVWGYASLTIAPEVDAVINHFYEHVIGPYWDDARRLVEEEYKTILFPFTNVTRAKFWINVEWTRDHLAGYLESWSSTQKYIKIHNHNPVPNVMNDLATLWSGDDVKQVKFPVFAIKGKL